MNDLVRNMISTLYILKLKYALQKEDSHAKKQLILEKITEHFSFICDEHKRYNV